MADVFISYSRKDIEFAQHIHRELEARDREPWVDWQDIPPTSEWLDEVYAGIRAADTFLFIISPDSSATQIFCGGVMLVRFSVLLMIRRR